MQTPMGNMGSSGEQDGEAVGNGASAWVGREVVTVGDADGATVFGVAVLIAPSVPPPELLVGLVLGIVDGRAVDGSVVSCSVGCDVVGRALGATVGYEMVGLVVGALLGGRCGRQLGWR